LTVAAIILPLSIVAVGSAATAAPPHDNNSAAAAVSLAFPTAANAKNLPWMDTSLAPEVRAQLLVDAMTLDEKIAQAHTTGSGVARRVSGIPRLGIPDFNITNGPAGVGTGTVSPQPKATALPAPVALAASFDPALARLYGTVEGRETLDVNHDLIEAPDVNIVRVPQGGRAFENFSEDPYLSAQTAVANISGIQAQGAIAEVKHYLANSQETGRKTIDERIDDRVLHEIYMPAFEAAAKAGVGAVMCAYPSVNGEFMCENKHLLTDVIRGQWGFDGFIQSDYTATHSAVGSVEAGMNLELRDNGPYDQELKQAVLDGTVSMKALDGMLIRRLATTIRFGSMDHGDTTEPIDVAAGGDVARKVAEQGTVLLKNSGDQLPLAASALSSIAVIGPYAEQAHPGGGGSSHVDPFYTVSPVQGIEKRAGPDVTVRHSDGGDLTEAAQQAAASDVAVVIVGDEEKEGADRSTLALTGNQDELVRTVAAANPRTVVVLNSGAPVLMPWVGEVPAILEAWYPGQEDGNALASVLFGDVNPSGKLPVTFPRSDEQTPVSSPERFPGVNGTITYSEGLQVGYRWYDAQGIKPQFAFGYGLSYTDFKISKLVVTPKTTDGTKLIRVSFFVQNTGKVAGVEVPQVYLGVPAAGEPPKRLVGFDKVELQPGAKQRVTVTIDPSSSNHPLSIWDSKAQSWKTVDGEYTVYVGNSSEDIAVQDTITVRTSAGRR